VEGHLDAIAQQLTRALTEFFGLPFIYPMEPKDGRVEVAYGTLNLRSRPSPTGTILANMPDGAKVRVFGEWQGWYVVHYQNYVGYAAAAYIDT
jgi:N-acetylmuramoyl-L-alanine amidase